MKKSILFLIVSFSALSFISCGSKEYNSKAKTITISGEGVVRIEVDSARINLSVKTSDINVSEATKKNALYTNNAIKAILDCGVSQSDIRTTDYSIRDNYSNEAKGFYVTNSITVLVRDKSKASTVIDSAIGPDKANSISSISFISSDDENARKEAKILAVKNAYENALIYAEAAGCKIGKVLEINESRSYTYETQNFYGPAALYDTPIMSGSTKIESSVNIVYELIN